MKTQRLGFASHDGASRIHALLWQPDAQSVAPRGIVQIVHGMAEHIDRYEPFARYLVSQGFVVCANDHAGHGKSVHDEGDLGHLPVEGGDDVLIEDVHELRCMTAARFASTVPYVMFGHSMGSFVTRCYLTRHGEGLAAAVLCGTGQQPRPLARAGNMLSRLSGGNVIAARSSIRSAPARSERPSPTRAPRWIGYRRTPRSSMPISPTPHAGRCSRWEDTLR